MSKSCRGGVSALFAVKVVVVIAFVAMVFVLSYLFKEDITFEYIGLSILVFDLILYMVWVYPKLRCKSRY
jgi:membrane protein YdbS with pleckstrin-like domain